MKRISKIILISLICLICMLSSISFATQNLTTNESIPEQINSQEDDISSESSVVSNEDIMLLSETALQEDTSVVATNGDLYYIDEEVEITDEIVNGDVYVIAQKVKISSNIIYGNIFVIAEEIDIQSSITGYAYIMAEKINLTGAVEGMYVLADEFNVNNGAIINTDIKTICDKFNLNGIIARNLLISAEDINIKSTGEYEVSVKGNITYSGNLDADEELIQGQINKVEVPTPNVEEIQKAKTKSEITDFIIKSLTALVIIAIVVLLLKDKFNYEKRESISYVKDIAIGFGLLILIPIAAIIICITIIGLPIGIIAIILYALALYVSLPIASIVIANQIFNEKLDTNVKKIFAGLLIYVIIKGIAYLPVIGGIINFLSILFGFEVILKKIFIRNKKLEVKVVETVADEITEEK